MDEKKRPCGCVRECPCYPRCDEMMEHGQMAGGIPQSWWRGQSQMMPDAGMQTGQMGGANGGMMQRGMMMGNEMPQQNMTPWQNVMPSPMGMPDSTMEEEERDWQRLKELYPNMAKIILAEVERACDKMEYEGSAMFDAMPDKTRMRSIANEIFNAVSDRIPAEQVEEQADMYTMNREPCRNCRPNQNFLGDFIEVMLYQEMFHRRCRHRNCRRW